MTYTPDDDNLHVHLAEGEWWFTETSWYSFHDAARGIGGWFYSMIRPTIGTIAGGAWVWDDQGVHPWEIPYSANFSALALPDDLDFRDAHLPTGLSIKVEEPMLRYHLRFDDQTVDRRRKPPRLTADLTFAAIDPPRPLGAHGSTFGHAAHYDQIGHVTGHLELLGERIEIDCWSMRDRTWGRRPETRPRRAAYVTGAASGGRGFLAVTNIRDGQDRLAYGFVRRDDGPGGDGQRTLVEGERRVVRHHEHGWIEAIEIDAVDVDGRPFHARGEAVNRTFINRHTFIDINSVVRWSVSGGGMADDIWWGEDQDMWPMGVWSDTRRAGDWNTP